MSVSNELIVLFVLICVAGFGVDVSTNDNSEFGADVGLDESGDDGFSADVGLHWIVPDCDDSLIEPVDTNVKDGFIDNKGYWSKSDFSEILYHKWFSRVTPGSTATETINVYKCLSNNNNDNCVVSQALIPEAYTIDNMDNVDLVIKTNNFENRVKTCMP